MIVFIFLLFFVNFSFTESCIKVTTTTPPSCLNCDENTIGPVHTDPATTHEFIDLTDPNFGCKITKLVCKRTDDQICATVRIRAGTVTSGFDTYDLVTQENTNSAEAELLCQRDNFYSFARISGMNNLYCDFENCAVPVCKLKVPMKICQVIFFACSLCETNRINVIMTDPDGTSAFEDSLSPDRCKTSQFTCKRTDHKVCAAVRIRITSWIGSSLQEAPSTNSLTSELTCSADGTIAIGTLRVITQLQCEFEDCAEPPSCTSCNLNTIAPVLIDPATTIDIEDITDSDTGCKLTMMTCKRTDNQICGTVTIIAIGGSPVRIVQLISEENANAATFGFSCNHDGTYFAGPLVGITQLYCDFGNCAVPPSCTSCDVNLISPTMTDPATSFQAIDGTDPSFGCKLTEVICKRTDNKICVTVRIRGTGTGGTLKLSFQNSANSNSATLGCSADGTFQGGGITALTQLYCDFENCQVPCTTCNANALAPILTDPATAFESGDSTDAAGCRTTKITCKRTDDKLCALIRITATASNFIGQAVPAVALNGNSASLNLNCATEGTYSVSSLQGITQLGCEFENCAVPTTPAPPKGSCYTCTRSQLAPASMPIGASFYYEEAMPFGQCVSAVGNCYRSDNKICQSILMKANGNVIAGTNNGYDIGGWFDCNANGVFTYNGEEIGRLECEFNNCN